MYNDVKGRGDWFGYGYFFVDQEPRVSLVGPSIISRTYSCYRTLS